MEGGGEESPACDRNWGELHRDVLMLIFLKTGLRDVLTSAGSVCCSWRKVAKEEPDLWRKIDMTNHGYGADAFMLIDPTKLAIDRSMGRLEEFSVENFANDALLRYLCDRTSVLKRLCLISCYELSDAAIAETARRQPLLEEIQIIFGSFSEKVTEILGKECPQLKIFKLNSTWYDIAPFDDYEEGKDDDEALGIAKTMHQLRQLQLIGNRLTNKGLEAILDGCPHLEMLDIRRCFNVIMDANMLARCAKLKAIRLPTDSVDDYEFEADADRAYCSDEDDFYPDLDYDYDDYEYGDGDYENFYYDDIFDAGADADDDEDDEVEYVY